MTIDPNEKPIDRQNRIARGRAVREAALRLAVGEGTDEPADEVVERAEKYRVFLEGEDGE